MKKLEQDMVDFINNRRWGGQHFGSNTVVTTNNLDFDVYLHTHHIVRGRWGGSVYINMCGFPTNTTRSRINAIGSMFKNRPFRVMQINGGQFLQVGDGKLRELKTDGWVRV